MTHSKVLNSKEKIYEHNPDTGVTRWRYINESIDDFGWPFYGRIIKDKAGKKFLKDLKIDDARVYNTADNLFTFTKYLGQDPEVRLPGGDPFDISIDYSRTPPTRRISIGLSTRF